ncbi:MAG: DNA mismatch endonuclease Vsr [Phycisphaerales bacterium]
MSESTTSTPLGKSRPRTDDVVSVIMSRVRGRDTAPEKAFRSALFKEGLRFRVCESKLPGKPDIVFPGPRLAVFVDGDYWHGNQWRRRGLRSIDEQVGSINNADYWRRKIQRNRSRDFSNTATLLDRGWRVLRVWESDLKNDLDRCVDSVVNAVRAEAHGSGFAYDQLANRSVVEFFAGIGLVRLALDQAGWQTIFANDIDADKFDMYEGNFGDNGFLLGDIHGLRGADLPAAGLVTASFPCTDLSIAGARRGLDGDHSGAFWAVTRLLDELGDRKPPLVLFENVLGFLRSRGGRDLDAALRSLNKLGYAIDLFTLNADRFAPQSRPRLFIIARPSEANDEVINAGDLESDDLRPDAIVEFIRSHEHLDWSLRCLPGPPDRHAGLDDILEDLPEDDPHWWNEDRAAYFLNQMSERHREIANEMIAGTTWSYATAFRRIRRGRSMAELRTDGIAGCLRTPRGGSARQILFAAGCGHYRVRLLTARECARLQGAPDDFVINTTLNKALFGFGDAVCVPVVEWIARQYLTPLAAELLRGRTLAAPD